MTRYAETQTTINGPYEPTNRTLLQCWLADLGNMTDYNLIRDNADRYELQLLKRLRKVAEYITDDDYNDELIDAFDFLSCSVEDCLIEKIWARVSLQGYYYRDGKITREEEV